jgi:hypothetical protein
MKKILLIFTLILSFTCSGFTQVKVKKSSLSPLGGSAVNGNITVTYTAGELNVRETKNGNTGLSEGFISSDIRIALKTEDYSKLTGLRVFPNPVKDNLTIENTSADNYEIYLFDVTGKEIFLRYDNKGNTKLNMSNYPPGIYFITIVDRKNRKDITFKLKKD